MSAAYSGRSLQLPMSLAEREKITNAAAIRDLNDSTFVRLLVAGALAKGEIDSYLTAGEKLIQGPVKRRTGRLYKKLWTTVGPMTLEMGEWTLVKMTTPSDSKGGDDQSKWWHLTHHDRADLMVPIAFGRDEAMKLAVEMIEGDRVPRS